MGEKTALVIIDVQSGFFNDEDFIYMGNEFLSKIQILIPRARAAGIPVIYVQHDGGKGDSLESGKPGWSIHPSIAPRDRELVIHKHTPDSFHSTTLQSELDSRGIKRLVFAGFQSDWCIDTTTRRAYSLGYDLIVVEDAHSTYEIKILKAPQIIAHHNSIFGGRFAVLKKVEDIDFNNL